MAIKRHPETGKLNVEVTGLRGDSKHYGIRTYAPQCIGRVEQTKRGEERFA